MYLLFLGIQVLLKPTHHDVGVQCSLLTTTHISTPKKDLAFSDSDLSDIEVDKQHHNLSYVPLDECYASQLELGQQYLSRNSIPPPSLCNEYERPDKS